MRVIALLTVLIGLGVGLVLWFDPSVAEAAPHWEADLVWTQPAPAPTSVRVEKKMGATGTYAPLTTLGPAALTFTDVGPYTDGQVVCWHVVAVNAQGATTGDETCSGAPVQFPGKPGAPAIQWRFLPN